MRWSWRRRARPRQTGGRAADPEDPARAQLNREAADRQSERSLAAARALLLSQQVSKGFEDLGSKDGPMIVLGGIYALEGVMQAPEMQYHRAVLEALCAFVRDQMHDRKPPTDQTKTTPEPPTTEIWAALTVIARRPADLAKLADLSEVQLSGSGVILMRADLSGASLDFADLGNAGLSNANLESAGFLQTNLRGANLVDSSSFSLHLHAPHSRHHSVAVNESL